MSFQSILNIISLWALPFIIVLILTTGMVKKVPVYEVFTEGAKDGFKVAVNIIPYLVAIIVAISMLRASGAIEMLANAMSSILIRLNIPADVLPVIFVRPLSGSAALGLFSDIATTAGPTAYSTKLAAVMVGSSETTFYVLAVYFGAVGITKFRYALWVGLLADIIAAIMSIIVCGWVF
ncbi:MAG: spore maturation protein [Candidatus Gastranaerophilales bacterium]|nr:spore maturation protein [Candidatus Gastranaerophilales bacterium]